MANSKVTVQADDQGNVIRVSKNNPEFGHMRLIQNQTEFSTSGWVNNKQRSTLVHGTIENLTTLGFTSGQQLEGNIIVTEQLTPFSETESERDLKMAGDTGITCMAADPETGEIVPIYRRTKYDPTGLAKPAYIPHVNADEIRAANGITSTVSTNEEKPMSKKEKEQLKEVVKEEAIEVENETFEL